MIRIAPKPARRDAGFTCIELMIAVPILLTGLVSVSALLASTSRQNEEMERTRFVLEQAQMTMETIKGANPRSVEARFDGLVRSIDADAVAAGVDLGGGVIAVDIDATLPNLLAVTVVGRWNIGDDTDSVLLTTQIHNP